MPGLRNAAFVDEFGKSGLKLSISPPGRRLEVLRTRAAIAVSKCPGPGTTIHGRCRTCADPSAAGCGH